MNTLDLMFVNNTNYTKFAKSGMLWRTSQTLFRWKPPICTTHSSRPVEGAKIHGNVYASTDLQGDSSLTWQFWMLDDAYVS